MEESLNILIFEPGKDPYQKNTNNSVKIIIEIVHGWFQVMSIGNSYILYCNCNSHNGTIPFNRMVDSKPIYGTFLISKLGKGGKRISLNSEEINLLTKEFTLDKSLFN
jgi:hypothetical protein